MNKIQSNFVLRIMKGTSPVLITVPHGGLKNSASSWLDALFEKRTLSENPEKNVIRDEKIVLGGDGQILHVAMDIIKECPVNLIAGLLPRAYVDYNRFIPEVAYADKNVRPFYEAYHQEISSAIERLLKWHKMVYLFDFHGFGKQPMPGKEYDIILGTNGETCPGETDKRIYKFLSKKYSIFCAGQGNNQLTEFEAYKGNTSNLHYYKQYGIESMLVEISPKFRSAKNPNSKELGQMLSKDLAKFFTSLV